MGFTVCLHLFYLKLLRLPNVACSSLEKETEVKLEIWHSVIIIQQKQELSNIMLLWQKKKKKKLFSQSKYKDSTLPM